VVALVPELSKLEPDARQNLHAILSNPGTATELFALIAKLIKKEEVPVKPEVDSPKG